MKKKQENGEKIKIIITIIFMICFIILVTNSTKILQKSTELFVVANGSLYYEEPAEGYLIRDEIVLQGENYKNGMVQVLQDGQRAAISEPVFRYYSNSEDAIVKQMAELDEEINEIIENSGLSLPTNEIFNIEKQIEDIVDSMYNLNYLQKINENKNKIEAYISKKAQITATLSPSDSYIKKLTDQRNALENELASGSEIVLAPVAGTASYRVDGIEDVLKVNKEDKNNFEYLSTELLDSFDLKVGAVIPLSNEKGKIVNNFECYIATPMNTEKAMTAQVGDKVTLRLSNSKEVDAELVYIKEESDNRILVFKIEENITELLEYRKISFDIIWWKYTGWKVSNSCLIEEDDKMYVEKSTAAYVERILVKVLRQNDTYSIVRNYEKEELIELGYTEEEISNMTKIKLYDQIISH